MANLKESISVRLFLQVVLFIAVFPLLPLLITRRWDWWEAWVYAGVSIFGFILSRLLAARRHPDLLIERARFFDHADAEPWERVLVPALALAGMLIPLTAGLEGLGGSRPLFSPVSKTVSLAVLLAGHALASYALVANRFFSGVVRIQAERGHHVITGGPYRWIRHPGYAGAILTYLATPVLLDSPWTILPAGLSTAVLALRTVLEDRTLQRRLDGYSAYATAVPYRLVPWIW